MRVVVFGANGATGRRLVDQALAAGHRVVAVTRRPDDVSSRVGLTVARVDVTDGDAVDTVVAGSDAVLSVLGDSYSRRPINVYSVGARNIIAAMKRHGVTRLVVVGSAAIDPGYRPSNSFFYTRVVEPLFMRRPGRTLYADNGRMEDLVRASDVNWTIIRSCWLFDSAEVTRYRVSTGSAQGMFTARSDLAACMLTQLTDDRFVRKVVAVSTIVGTPNLIRQIWREGIKKEKKH
jgi:putative NADH-flavin reductase